jgi:pyruvate-ferredoxin/flavodoxin oxidoreductase
MERAIVTCDGNEAAADIAYQLSDVVAIYPITPATPMGELADEWSARGRANLWGAVPRVVEMQSEAGAAGTVHGALQAGALATTFTASQGLLLMIPNMFKIAGELTPAVIHVAARAVATHALSIFGDHSDVMAARSTGWGMLAASSVQEAHDLALVAHAATLEARVPFVHFFDGFRTSHELNQVERLDEEDLRALVRQNAVRSHRARGLTPDNPVLRGTAQNPDIFFQSRERANPFYDACPAVVADVMARFAERTGRRYRLFEYDGHPDAQHVLVLMGSGAETARETVRHLTARGERVGVVTVRLFRPFSSRDLLAALPATTRVLAVLDRTKEPGAPGEPLFLDVASAVAEGVATGQAPFAAAPRVIGGRYGLGSKELTPAMVAGVLAEAARPAPRARFTVGIEDDLGGSSIPYDRGFSIEDGRTVRAVFYGLGSDGTVGANKNSIKILAGTAGHYAQGYFVYDSKKAGTVTVSHLRFGPRPIRAPYQIDRANFVACHQWSLLARMDVLAAAEPGAVVLLNSPYPPERVWDELPRRAQATIRERGLRLYVIDAYAVAREAGLGGRINTVMQTCFFSLSGVLPAEEAIPAIKDAIARSYAKRGEEVVAQNWAAVDAALAHLHEVPSGDALTGPDPEPFEVPGDAPAFVTEVLPRLLAGEGDALPVSAMPPDGTFPLERVRDSEA